METTTEIDKVTLMQWQMYQACCVLHALLEDPTESPAKHRAAETLLKMASAVANNPTQEGFDRAVRILLIETAAFEAEMQPRKH